MQPGQADGSWQGTKQVLQQMVIRKKALMSQQQSKPAQVPVTFGQLLEPSSIAEAGGGTVPAELLQALKDGWPGSAARLQAGQMGLNNAALPEVLLHRTAHVVHSNGGWLQEVGSPSRGNAGSPGFFHPTTPPAANRFNSKLATTAANMMAVSQMPGQAGEVNLDELLIAERELEQELHQLELLQQRVSGSGGSHTVTAAATADVAAAEPTSPLQAGSPAEAAAAAVAEALSAALEDPSASAKDIAAILDSVLALNKQTCSSSQHQDISSLLASGNQALWGAAAVPSAAALSGPAASHTTIAALNSTANNIAAQLQMPDAARYCGGQVVTAPAAATLQAGANGTARTAAARNIEAWRAEGGLMYKNTAHTAGNAQPPGLMSAPKAASHARPPSPCVAAANVGYAAAAEARLTPAEQEKLWRQGLRGPGSICNRQGCEHAEVHKYPADGAEGWMGYEGQDAAGRKGQGLAAAAKGKAQQTPELDEKLQRLYARNIDWKRRCKAVYERQRSIIAKGETAGCTFAPNINPKSEKIARHLGGAYPMRPIRPATALATSEDVYSSRHMQRDSSKPRPASTGRIDLRTQRRPASAEPAQGLGLLQSSTSMQQRVGAMPAAVSSVASTLANTVGQQLLNNANRLLESSAENAENAREQSITPSKHLSTVDRLYEDAAIKRERAAKVAEVTNKVEKQARAWSAPRSRANAGVAPRLYDHLQPSGSPPRQARHQHVPTGTDVCTFQPRTNRRPKSPTGRDHLHASQQQRQQKQHQSADAVDALQSQLQHWAASAGCQDSQRLQQQQQHADSTAAQRAGTDQAARSITNDLDWSEFIDRQGRFLLVKEAKLAGRAANMAHIQKIEMSPGTKRILQQQEQQTADSVQARVASGSPAGTSQYLAWMQQQLAEGASTYGSNQTSRQAGMLRGVHNKPEGKQQQLNGWEFTFKPVITRKGAAMKPRPFEDMSEGDRLRREAKLVREPEAAVGAVVHCIPGAILAGGAAESS
eukprot:GHRR01007908.1.p1 GENE.GHRR01007908.1~~GHRR01007908.1.p1  ORF type:complete len:997 (+),score=431.54 GHRR01007908.1:3390-6380(+)